MWLVDAGVKMISEFKIAYIKHSELTTDMLNKIVWLKKQCWPYSIESQIKWIKDNIEEDDFHLCIEDSSGYLIGYLNLIYLKLKTDKVIEEVIGVGNVCVEKTFRGKNVGKLLMHICNYYISVQEKRGALLCKHELCQFYKKSGWIEFGGHVLLKGNNYNGLVMFDCLPDVSSIEIEKNF